VLERHIRLGVQTNAGTEDVGDGSTLFGQGVNDRGTGRRQRCLEHVAEDAQHAVEALVLVRAGLPLDARHHLGDEDEIDDERGGQEGVLADVEDPVHQVVNLGSVHKVVR